jgi:hypothetical protein
VRFFTFLFLLSTAYCGSYCQLSVNYINATQFVQILAGPNVSFANAVFSGTDPVQMGSFAGFTSPNIGISSGVMLATGDALVAEDTANNCTAGNALGGGGDADLSGACQQPTHDLGAIEFDFWVPTDSVALTFMFASEEYNYWVNSKNDVCGARLYNAGGGYANILYLPGSFTPVCVNNINNGSVANICDPSAGPCTNCQYYHDNPNGTTFQYNGYTDLFTIKFHVTPCDTFHFWMGIADAQDFIYDSAILLPEGGFRGAGADSSCDGSTSIIENKTDIKLAVFPNPFVEKILITIQKQNLKGVKFIVTDIFGQMVFRNEESNLNNTYTKTIDLSFLSKGIYFLDAAVEGTHTLKKIVKE